MGARKSRLKLVTGLRCVRRKSHLKHATDLRWRHVNATSSVPLANNVARKQVRATWSVPLACGVTHKNHLNRAAVLYVVAHKSHLEYMVLHAKIAYPAGLW